MKLSDRLAAGSALAPNGCLLWKEGLTEDGSVNVLHLDADVAAQIAREPDTRGEARQSSPSKLARMEEALRGLLELMEMQEQRASGDLHISLHSFRPMWDEGKARARSILDEEKAGG